MITGPTPQGKEKHIVSSDKAYQYTTTGCAFLKQLLAKKYSPVTEEVGRGGGALFCFPKMDKIAPQKRAKWIERVSPEGREREMPQENNNGDEYTAYSYG